MHDHWVEINNVKFYPQRNGHKTTDYFFGGIYYDTEEEWLVAQMLTKMGIRFLHHVIFSFRLDKDKQLVIWCPDFVLEKPFRWVGPVCNGSVVVGLEVKHTHIRGKPRGRSRALLASLGIPILLIPRSNIVPYFEKQGVLPLKPLRQPALSS